MNEKSVRSRSRDVTIVALKKEYSILKLKLEDVYAWQHKLVSSVKFHDLVITWITVGTVIRQVDILLLLYAS
jgi:hypothetical protein